MPTLDLDARRAEAHQETHKLVLGGVTYELPAKLPLAIAQYLIEGRTADAIRVLFGDDAAPDVEMLLTDEDLDTIARELYGVTPGESTPAPLRWPTNGTPSKRTSAGTTRRS